MDSTFLIIVVFLGSLISGVTGLVGGSFILGTLLVFYPPNYALPLHGFSQLIINIVRASLFFKKVEWRIVTFFSLLMLPGAWIGARIFDQVNSGFLKIIVAIFLFLSIAPMPYVPRIIPGKKTFLIMGCFSGFVSIFIGATGPLIMPFFNRLELSRDEMLSTKSAGQSILQFSKLIAFWGASSINFRPITEKFPSILFGILIGISLSIPLGRKISDIKFNMIINIILMIIALNILVEGIKEV